MLVWKVELFAFVKLDLYVTVYYFNYLCQRKEVSFSVTVFCLRLSVD